MGYNLTDRTSPAFIDILFLGNGESSALAIPHYPHSKNEEDLYHVGNLEPTHHLIFKHAKHPLRATKKRYIFQVQREDRDNVSLLDVNVVAGVLMFPAVLIVIEDIDEGIRGNMNQAYSF